MTPKALFGRYWEADSLVHRLDPRTKLASTFVLVVMVFLATSWPKMLFVAMSVAALFVCARIPLLQAARSVAPVLFIAILAVLFNVFFVHGGQTLVDWGWLKITTEGLSLGAFMGVRLMLLLLLGSLLTMTTTTIDITEATESLLSPLAHIGVPVHEFAFVMGTALRFLPQFADEFHSIRMAQIARGARLSTSPTKGMAALASLVVPMFASVFRHADTLSAAMDARCYHGAGGRTRLDPLRFRRRDAIAAAALAALVVVTVLI